VRDELEELRRYARLETAEEISLLIGTLTEAEYERLGELLARWRAGEAAGPPTRAEVRACLDPVAKA
jgi:hypothetical protein